MDNFRRDLLRELDFGRECKSLSKFEENFKEDPLVIIPKPYPELSSKRVMTMSRVSGTSVNRTAELEAAGHDLKDIAERGANIFIKMIFEHRCVQRRSIRLLCLLLIVMLFCVRRHNLASFVVLFEGSNFLLTLFIYITVSTMLIRTQACEN